MERLLGNDDWGRVGMTDGARGAEGGTSGMTELEAGVLSGVTWFPVDSVSEVVNRPRESRIR